MNKTITKYWPAFFIYLVVCCFRSFQRDEGDIHIYLNAANMFLGGENIYPYYLYPPPSILFFAPMTLAGDSIGRVIWALINFCMFIRVLSLLYVFCKERLTTPFKTWKLFLLILICCIGMIDHNLQLGQMTIVMLWTSLEFCSLMNNGKEMKAAFVLAYGIMMKLIPGLLILWLLAKKKYKLIGVICFILLGLSILPGLLNRQANNLTLWSEWLSTINPFGERFGIESSMTVISLNGFIPAYMSLINERVFNELHPIIATIFVNVSRVFLVLLLWAIYKKTSDKFSIFEISITLLICILIFPHQMKYSMLLFTPAMILILINLKINYDSNSRVIFKFSNFILLLLFFFFSIYGRDTIGDNLVDFLDSSRFFTWLILISMVKLLFGRIQNYNFWNKGMN